MFRITFLGPLLRVHVSWPANTLAVANHRGARERIAVHVSLPSVHGDSLRPKCSPAKVFAGQSVAGQRVPRRTDAHGDSLRGPHALSVGVRLCNREAEGVLIGTHQHVLAVRRMFEYFFGSKKIRDISSFYKKEYVLPCSLESAGPAIILSFPNKETLVVAAWDSLHPGKLYQFSETADIVTAKALAAKINDVCRMIRCSRGLGCTSCHRHIPVGTRLRTESSVKELDCSELADYMTRYPGWLPIHYVLAMGFPYLCGSKEFPTIDNVSIVDRLFRVNVDVELSKKKGIAKNESDAFPRCFFDNFPEYVSIQDPRTKQTLFHDLSNVGQLPALLNHAIGSPVLQFRNVHQETPLQFYLINQEDVSPIVQLICHGADVNDRKIVDKIPLLIAIRKHNVDFVKTLLVFGADVDRAFVADCVAMYNPRLSWMQEILSCIELYRSDEMENEQAVASIREPCAELHANVRKKWINCWLAAPQSQKKRLKNLIAFDGGGMAGVVLVQTLLALEERCGGDWFRWFDWVGGTSFGAILAILLCRGRSLRYIQKLVFRLKSEIFLFNDVDAATKALKRTFLSEVGEETMECIEQPRLVVTTCDASVRPAQLKLFRNYRPPSPELDCEPLGYDPPSELFLWRIAMCSTAVPGIFLPVDGKFVDGGLISNNPTQDLMTEFFRMKSVLTTEGSDMEGNIGCVVSVGAGISPRRIVSAPRLDWTRSLAGVVNNLGHLVNLFELLRSQVTATDDYVVDRCRAWCDSQGAPFFRLTPELSSPLSVDTTDDLSLINACWDTIKYFKMRPDDIQLLASIEVIFNSLAYHHLEEQVAIAGSENKRETCLCVCFMANFRYMFAPGSVQS
uniref:phospholipase A2 n=1 Tax=Trichuris muris TaxID=70415 RepID=A0A5S6QDE5_TRIMR